MGAEIMKHKRKVILGTMIVIIVVLLLSLKACTKEEGLIFKERAAYIEAVEKLAETGDDTLDHWLGVLEEMPESALFACDEALVSVFKAFGEAFQETADTYQSMQYIGEEAISDVSYFDLKLSYYAELGRLLIQLSSDLELKQTARVLEGFDEMLVIIQTVRGENE